MPYTSLWTESPVSPVSEPVFEFGEFELDCARFQLSRRGRSVRVEPKPLELLILLVAGRGRLVSRREIVEKLWDRDVFVDTDHSINTAIRKLRYLLRDDPELPQFIETVTGMGYRFIAPVAERNGAVGRTESSLAATTQAAAADSAVLVPLVTSPVEVTAQVTTSDKELRRASAHRKGRIALAAAAVALLGAAAWYFAWPLPALRVVSYTQITHDGGHKAPVGTDGSRLYFNRDGNDPIGEVSVDGGEARSIHVDLPDAGVGAVLQGGSGLLIGTNSGTEYSLWKLQLPDGALRRITGDELVNGRPLLNDAMSVAVSPNGQSIVFITNEGALVVMNGDGSHLRQLLSPPKGRPIGGDVTWSPDGKRLRFTWNHRYWEASADGSGLHAIRPGWRPGVWECCGQWTADGHAFIFIAPEADTKMPMAYGQLWALDECAGMFSRRQRDPSRLTTEPMLWTALTTGRDAQKLFAEGVILRGELVHFDAAAHELRPLLHGISAEYVAYSPDGKSIVYVSFPDGIMWRANRDGSNPVQLTSPPIYPINPWWSPDGSRILFFTTGYGEPRRAYTVSAEGGSEPVQVVPADHPTEMLDPSWSPDGSRIVYATSGWENAPQEEIEVLDMATRRTTKVKGSADMWSPRWSPDGRHIAALDATWSLAVFDFESQKWRTLTKGACNYPVWSRDSRWIYYIRTGENDKVFRVSVDGGEPQKVFEFPSISYTGALNIWFGMDPDGTPMFLRDAGSDEIYSLILSRR